jgi:MFS family permease
MAPPSKKTLNKWFVLALGTTVQTLAVGCVFTAMPVLFPAASKELGMSLAQVGMIWGMMPLGSAVFSIIGGMMGDRLGFVKTVGIACFIIAIVNALRALSPNITVLAITMFGIGAGAGIIFPCIQKTPTLFFKGPQVAMATGIVISGFAIGGVLATALSATVLMDILGNWRNVLFFYSAIAVICGIVWLAVLGRASIPGFDSNAPKVSIKDCLRNVLRMKEVWLIALGNMGIIGSFSALNGYFPTFIQKLGVSQSMGDTMSSTLFVASIVGAIVLPTLASKFHAGKAVIIICSIITCADIALCAVLPAAAFWVLIPIAGIVTQAVGTTVLNETVALKGIGTLYGGTALGFLGTTGNIGGFLMPLAGGALAETNIIMPFWLWAAICFCAVICFVILTKVSRKTSEARAA